MINGDGWIVVSTGLRKGMVQWPGDTTFEINTSIIKEGNLDISVSEIKTSLHVGTHIDAPLHYITNGDDVTKFNTALLIGGVKVISISNKQKISEADLKNKQINKGDRIFFKTNNSSFNWINEPFKDAFVALDESAARYLAEKEIAMVGIDYISIASIENCNEVHTILLQKSICIVEGLLLNTIEEGIYEMICLPLYIETAEGSPATIVMRKAN
jgi:arylformamidase